MGGLSGMSSPPICHPTHPYIRKPLALRGLSLTSTQYSEVSPMDIVCLAYENFSYYGGEMVGMLKMCIAGTGELQPGKGFHTK